MVKENAEYAPKLCTAHVLRSRDAFMPRQNRLSCFQINGLSHVRCQDSIWNNAGLLLTGRLWTNFSRIWIKIHKFSFKKMNVKILHSNWLPFCHGFDELSLIHTIVSRASEAMMKNIDKCIPWIPFQIPNKSISSISHYVLHIMLTSPVARPEYYSKFWGNHFIAFFDRYNGPD